MTTPRRAPSICPALSKNVIAIPGRIQELKFSFTKNTTEKDTAYDLPPKSLVVDVVANVVTAKSGASIKVGILSTETTGYTGGFANSLLTDTTGISVPLVTITSGTNEKYYSGNTHGTLISDYVAGSNTATDHGLFNKKLYSTDANTGRSVSYTTTNHVITGTIHIYYIPVDF